MIPLHEQVWRAILGCGSAFTNEDEMQQAIAELLRGAGYPVQREFDVGRGMGRIDLAVHGMDLGKANSEPIRIGIECKVAGPCDALQRQLRRYAETGLFDRLVVATTRAVHEDLHGIPIDGVPVDVIVLRGGIC